MKFQYYLILLAFVVSCKNSDKSTKEVVNPPFLNGLNVPVDYAQVSGADVEQYVDQTVKEAVLNIDSIIRQEAVTFENLFVALDDVNNRISTCLNNSFVLYWVSPDSVTRAKGLAGYQVLDSLNTSIYSNKPLYDKMLSFTSTESYKALKGHKKLLADDLILRATRSGVNLDEEKLARFKQVNKEINQLSSQYSDNMNAANDVLVLDDKTAKGLPEDFKNRFKTGDNKYEVPVINANLESMLGNADLEETRKAFYFKYYNRAANKNLAVLDSLILRRHQLATTVGFPTYAAYNLVPKMAKDPATVWAFINDLVSRVKAKAGKDIELLKNAKKQSLGNTGNVEINPWDVSYYRNQVQKTQFQFDAEKLRDYLPMKECLAGMFTIYQDLLGLQFKKVENASVWHEEVEQYEVYEGKKLVGRFYLDLFPRPNKESWFYGVTINTGKKTADGYEIPVCLLLGNFTRATKDMPSLLSYNELNTLFHEFGHVVNTMAYHGDYSSQANSKEDFAEAMSQLFENWILDYPTVSSFAKHYKTGEVLPKDLFENMLKAKNITSGIDAARSLSLCLYDMNIYDRYDPAAPLSTDKLWQKIDNEVGAIPTYVPGTHRQANWIHINTNPVYYYGYLWSEVYAQDMFTLFEKNGLTDKNTGIRYRELILANGTQRDVVEAVEEFLGRRSNNEAYIKSLGLD